MDILLIRHFTSTKNSQRTFSSADDGENLTVEGLAHGQIVAENIKNIVSMQKGRIKAIYCADSVRAVKSAELIAKAMGVPVISYKALLSTKSADTLGRTRDEVRLRNPMFIRELELYDVGLFSSYSFHREVGRTQKRQYEKAVHDCVEKIIGVEDEDYKIIVLHHSSITAVLIDYARRYYNYPEDYYGKVVSDQGCIYWIHSTTGATEFKAVNCTSEQLVAEYTEYVKSLCY